MNGPTLLRSSVVFIGLLGTGCGLHRIPTTTNASPPAAAVRTPQPATATPPSATPAQAGDAAAAYAQTLLRAQLELQKVQTYTGLSDAQLDRLRTAEVALATGQGDRALAMLRALNDELAKATQRYVVAAGDSLWIISGRPEVYGNPYLWPLIWDANLDSLADPDRLRAGQRLRIRTNPTIDEVVQAVARARHYRSPTIRIGEVREAGRP